MRNTKPPLLFWQAMASGDWSAQGGLAALRWPSVAYTLLTTAGLGAIALRISGQARTALLAALLYLAFFSTFRYGRVYLTSAPETFWLALPMGWLLWLQSRPAAAQAAAGGPMAPLAPSIGFYAVAGLAMGLGLLYKSFALIAPAAATLWCALVLQAGRPLPATWLRISAGTALSALMAFAARGAVGALREPEAPDPDRPQTAFMLCVPLFHVTGLVPVMLGSFVSGSKLVRPVPGMVAPIT
jgi:4-amino-4-deoxy-L-arabinose transferase-like glycosyltransferase